MKAAQPNADSAGQQLTVAEMLLQRHGQLTRAQRKIFRLLTAQYPLLGLDTVTRLAGRAGVSAPIVIRLVEKLGFDSYADFQNALKAELGERLSCPLAMYGDRSRSEAEGIDSLLRLDPSSAEGWGPHAAAAASGHAPRARPSPDDPGC
jgi:DNA-binding MurR/RpiR family transcriptional regulator